MERNIQLAALFAFAFVIVLACWTILKPLG